MATRQQILQESITALRQGDQAAQVAAIYALGRLDDPRGIPALVAALASRAAEIRVLAIGKLVFLNNAQIIPALVKALADREPRVRQHALYALQRLKARQAAGRIAGLLARDSDPMVRFNAVLALAAVGGRRHKAAFVKAVDDSHRDVMVTALGALTRVAPEEVSKHILRLVKNTKRWSAVPEHQKDVILRFLKDSLHQKEVVAVLRRIAATGLAAAKRAGKPPMSMELMEAARLLADAGDATGVPVLLHALKGGEYAQEKAMAALVALRHQPAVPGIIAGPLQSDFYAIKLKAVRALGELGDVRALPALAGIFNGRVDDFHVESTNVFTKDDPDLRLTALAAMATIAAQNVCAATHAADPCTSRLARKLLKTA